MSMGTEHGGVHPVAGRMPNRHEQRSPSTDALETGQVAVAT